MAALSKKKAPKTKAATKKTRAGKVSGSKAPAARAATKKAPAKTASTKKASTKKAAGNKAPAAKATAKKSGKVAEPERSAPPMAEVDAEVLEFIAAIDRFKQQHGRPFPSWSEVLLIVRELGYRRVD